MKYKKKDKKRMEEKRTRKMKHFERVMVTKEKRLRMYKKGILKRSKRKRKKRKKYEKVKNEKNLKYLNLVSLTLEENLSYLIRNNCDFREENRRHKSNNSNFKMSNC